MALIGIQEWSYSSDVGHAWFSILRTLCLKPHTSIAESLSRNQEPLETSSSQANIHCDMNESFVSPQVEKMEGRKMTLLCPQEKWQEGSTDPSAALSLALMPGSEDTTAQEAGKDRTVQFLGYQNQRCCWAPAYAYTPLWPSAVAGLGDLLPLCSRMFHVPCEMASWILPLHP